MKRLIKNTIIAALAAVTLAACSDSEGDSLSLDGDCNVEAVKLDDFIGNCDPKTRNILVRLPEVYETSATGKNEFNTE